MSSPTGRKVKSTASVNLEKNQKTLERLKKKLELRLKERDSMTERFKLLIKQEQSKSKRQINATERVTNDYKYLTNRINSIRAEILSLEGGIITKEVLPWVLGEQPKRAGFGRKFDLKSTYEINGKTYQYKEGDYYFDDKISGNELKIMKSVPNRPPEGGEYNLGDTAEGGEMSQLEEDTALDKLWHQELQIKNNESKVNKTYTNGTL